MKNRMKTATLAFPLLLAASVCFAADDAPARFYASGDPKKAEFALTFDDGPGYITEDLLKLLEKKGAKATFFMLGTSVRARPDKAREVAAAGHMVCSHTDTHLLWVKEARREGYEKRLEDELRKSAAAIEKAAGVSPKVLRMPNGYDKPWVRRVAGKLGYTLVNWTYGSDWTRQSEEKMDEGYLKALKPGAILLMHDGGGKARVKDLKLVELILDEAAKKGLRPVRVDELLGLRAQASPGSAAAPAK